MRDAGLKEIDSYISRWKNMVAQYIATHTIIDLCLDTERILGLRAPKRWWEQERLILPGRQTDWEKGRDRCGYGDESGDMDGEGVK